MAPMVASMICADNSKTKLDTETRQHPIADKSADNSDRHVTNYAKAGPLNNLTG
jgi:hypothetical protein